MLADLPIGRLESDCHHTAGSADSGNQRRVRIGRRTDRRLGRSGERLAGPARPLRVDRWRQRWHSDNWSTDASVVPTAAELGPWRGVGVANGRVVGLDLSTNFLAGPIPPELGRLSSLHELNLERNALTGPIPPDLGQMSSLERLWLSGNDLSGPLPPELGRLSSLEWLNLERNGLIGPVPPELGQLSHLQGLGLSSNKLTHSMPNSLTRLAKMLSIRWDDQDAEAGETALCAPADDGF